MNEVFDQFVKFLQLASEQRGMTYQELNVWIFYKDPLCYFLGFYGSQKLQIGNLVLNKIFREKRRRFRQPKSKTPVIQ